MLIYFETWVGILLMVHLIETKVIYNNHNVFLQEQSAVSFLSRSLLYNSWDFELMVPDNLERECHEEICNYEEAREVFEDNAQTAVFWETYVSSQEPVHKLDVSSLVAGLLAVFVIAIIATVLGCYIYRAKTKNVRRGRSVPVQMAADGSVPPESLPLSGIAVPGLPSYNEALNRSGQHDAPPPPYSGEISSEAPDPTEG